MTATLPLDTLDELTTPLLRLDAAGQVVDANLAAGRWLGVSRRRLLGTPAVALERDAQVLADGLRVALHQGHDAPLRLRRVALAAPGSAELHFADLWLSPCEAGGCWLEAHPVDEFAGDEQAQSLPSALSASLKGLAHELRNPLAGIKGAAQLLARRGDADNRELTTLIEAEVERLVLLVDRLLSPAPPRAFAALNIHAVLERVLRLAESEAGWATRLQRDYDPSIPDLDGDADRLMQALWNLVRNAIEAGASNVQLRTRIDHGARIFDAVHAQALRLDIIDDGHGVPSELAEQILLPLVSGRADGTGLGLALTQQIAREHRGSLAWRSRPGHTVFTLLLPLTEPNHDGAQP
ncbi:MAG TPA: ATP-binding protein [Thermomonas sp.]|jgi:two-component system nitrogen regulation sensor histidine kinase GlnL|uniref:two-component system sensor histidine kinase NtrB n=1 Tax=Thermomonas sp. TaxID=1971895 RepID=UPI002CF30ECE|nr:ATP-binding protein [Thermomonas sp.]HOV96483.1 ATP-binding protein [Thermomonas sp.]